MKIKVTEQHIRNGKRRDPYKCPIALAIYDVTGENCSVGYRIYKDRNNFNIEESILTPEEARRFIVHYDEKLPVYPGEFDIPLEHLGLKEKNENQSN